MKNDLLARVRASALLSILAAAVALPACTADSGDENLGDDEGAKRIKPTDGENLGRIQVNLPNGVPAVDPSTSASYRSTRLTFGTSSRFTADTGCLSLTSNSLSGVGNTQCGVAITRSQTTTVNLSGIRATYDTSATGPLAVDFGQRPSLTVTRTVSNAPAAVAVAANAGWNGSASAPVVVLSGDYTFDFGVRALDQVKQTIAPGNVANINLTPPDRRTTINVTQPTRELPDWRHPNYPQCMGASAFLVARNGSGDYGSPRYGGGDGVVASMALSATTNQTVHVFPYVAADGPLHYELVVNNVSVPIQAVPGGTVNLAIQRLDVDDVDVTDENGQVHPVRASFTVARQGPNNTWVPVRAWDHSKNCFNVEAGFGNFQTNTGIDLPDGTYRLDFSYTTAEGPKTQQQIVTLP